MYQNQNLYGQPMQQGYGGQPNIYQQVRQPMQQPMYQQQSQQGMYQQPMQQGMYQQPVVTQVNRPNGNIYQQVRQPMQQPMYQQQSQQGMYQQPMQQNMYQQPIMPSVQPYQQPMVAPRGIGGLSGFGQPVGNPLPAGTTATVGTMPVINNTNTHTNIQPGRCKDIVPEPGHEIPPLYDETEEVLEQVVDDNRCVYRWLVRSK